MARRYCARRSPAKKLLSQHCLARQKKGEFMKLSDRISPKPGALAVAVWYAPEAEGALMACSMPGWVHAAESPVADTAGAVLMRITRKW